MYNYNTHTYIYNILYIEMHFFGEQQRTTYLGFARVPGFDS